MAKPGQYSNLEACIAFTHAIGISYKMQKKFYGNLPLTTSRRVRTNFFKSIRIATRVPANLLKINLQFSHSMVELLSDPFIVVTRKNGNTLQKIYFAPSAGATGTIPHDQLTLWLDPGRLKEIWDPNVWLGAPLRENEQYTIDISPDVERSMWSATYKGISKNNRCRTSGPYETRS